MVAPLAQALWDAQRIRLTFSDSYKNLEQG
jgi:hypothetical protein